MEKNATMIHGQQTRREFCIRACQGGSALALSATLGQFLLACKDDPASVDAPSLPTIQGTSSGGTVTLTVDANSPLSAVGSAALVQFSGGSVLVAHIAQDTFTALTSVCTHQQCTVTGFKNQLFVCPCHGSQFQTNGQVAQGPASSPLRSFQTQFANSQLTITL
jgi:Rieske Fe-S protein